MDLLRVIGETAPDPIWVRDAQGRFAFVNPALGRLVGVEAGALIGETGSDTDVSERAAAPDDGSAARPRQAHPRIAGFEADMAVIRAGAPQVVEEEAAPPRDHRRTFLVSKTPMLDARGRVSGLVCVASDISDRKRAEERQALMVRELHHRVKNSLATVQAIANATARTATDIAAFREAFNARIISLARTHTLLTENAWGVIPLRDLLATELAPYETAPGGLRPGPGDGARRVFMQGPDVALPSDVALSIGMAVHELATNAVKYGALSTEAGTLSVTWSIGHARGPPLAAVLVAGARRPAGDAAHAPGFRHAAPAPHARRPVQFRRGDAIRPGGRRLHPGRAAGRERAGRGACGGGRVAAARPLAVSGTRRRRRRPRRSTVTVSRSSR